MNRIGRTGFNTKKIQRKKKNKKYTRDTESLDFCG